MKKVLPVQPPYSFESYTRILAPIADDEGGGFLVSFPDLPGCISDGGTEKEALKNGKDAFISWISARVDQGKAIPEPKRKSEEYVEADASGRLLARSPRYLHSRLIKRAERERVSVNSLVLAFIAAGLGSSGG